MKFCKHRYFLIAILRDDITQVCEQIRGSVLILSHCVGKVNLENTSMCETLNLTLSIDETNLGALLN